MRRAPLPSFRSITLAFTVTSCESSGLAAISFLQSDKSSPACPSSFARTKASLPLSDGHARKRASASIGLEIENLGSAIEEAKRRVEAAERHATLEAARENARRVREIATVAASRGARIAESARTLRDEITRLNVDLEQMRRLGAPVTGGR